MKKEKLKLENLKVKSFIISPKKDLTCKANNQDGGYTWVG